jgi:formiminoglutamase
VNINDYIHPVEKSEIKQWTNSKFVKQHVTFFSSKKGYPSTDNYHIALVGVPDDIQHKTFEAAKLVRNELYRLSIVNNCKIIDLGNVKCGHTSNDTFFALRDIISLCNSNKTIVLLMGGSSAFNLGGYMAYNKNQAPMNMVAVDSCITREKIPLIAVSDMVMADSRSLSGHFNYINIGYQSYFVERSLLNFMDDSQYEAYRLGYVRGNMREMEPVLRDSNLVSFSLNAVRYSDAPSVNFSSPNGFYGEEACQLAFYSGYSTRLQTFGVFDYKPDTDSQLITAKLAAQIIWYFLEGFSSAVFEEPDATPENFTKYHIHLDQPDQNIAFYKSNLTNRWWMEVSNSRQNRNVMLSCSQADYDLACRQEIPERWWRMIKRLDN